MKDDERDDLPCEDPDELLVHGLLLAGQETREQRERRVADVMRAVDAPKASAARARLVTRSRTRTWPVVLLVASLAAILFLGLFPRSSSAAALVRSSLAALEEGEVRRYRMETFLRDEPEPMLRGTVDLDGTGRVVIQVATAALVGFDVAVGRDAIGEWVAHSNQPPVRFPSEAGWPRWLQLEGSAVLVESVDALLRDLSTGYELTHGDRGEQDLVHVVADRRTNVPDDDPRAHRVELWIERRTHTLERLELSWPDDPRRAADLEDELRRRHPDILPEAPDFRAGALLSPDRIVYALVADPELPPDWFAPETHGSAGDER